MIYSRAGLFLAFFDSIPNVNYAYSQSAISDVQEVYIVITTWSLSALLYSNA